MPLSAVSGVRSSCAAIARKVSRAHRLFRRQPRPHLVGHLVGMDEDPLGRAVTRAEWGVDEGEVHLLRHTVPIAVQPYRHLIADEGLAGTVDLIEEFDDPLPGQFREEVAYRAAEYFLPTDQRQIGRIGEGVHMVRPAEQADRGGGLRE